MVYIPYDIMCIIRQYKNEFETCEKLLRTFRKQIKSIANTANYKVNSLLYASYFIHTVDPSIDTAKQMATLVDEIKYFVLCVRHDVIPLARFCKSWEVFYGQPPMYDGNQILTMLNEPFAELFQFE